MGKAVIACVFTGLVAFIFGALIAGGGEVQATQTPLRAYSVTYDSGLHGYVCARNLAQIWASHPHGYMVTGRDKHADRKCN